MKKKCAIVTGAAGAIGRALVHAFSQAGFAVIATDRTSRPVDLVCEHFVQVDLRQTVSDPSFAASTFDHIRHLLDGRPLTALVNNAALQTLAPVDKLDRGAWSATLDVNLLAPFFWCQAFLPELSSSRGAILNVSSIHARLTKRQFVAYATSKAALSALTRSMAVELGAEVRVLAIEPAAIDTDMLRAGFAGNEEGLRRLKDYHPTRCIGTPIELAELAVSLVNLPGEFLTGAIVALDGAIGTTLHDPG